MKRWAKGSCFFCGKRKAKFAFSLKPPAVWPEPLEAKTKIGMCAKCSELSAEKKSAHICDYVNALRKIHNRRVILESN